MEKMKKFKGEIEEKPVVPERRIMTVEFWATDEKQAMEKLDWLITDRTKRNWYNLEEVKEGGLYGNNS